MKTKKIPLIIISGQCGILNCKCGFSTPFKTGAKTVVCVQCAEIYQTLKSFPEKLRAYRDLNYYNNDQLAVSLNYSISTVKHWLDGKYSESNRDVIRATEIMKDGGIG